MNRERRLFLINSLSLSLSLSLSCELLHRLIVTTAKADCYYILQASFYYCTALLLLRRLIVTTSQADFTAQADCYYCIAHTHTNTEAEIADAIEDAERELGEPEPTPHELFVDSVFDSLEEVQQVYIYMCVFTCACVYVYRTRCPRTLRGFCF